MSRGEILIVAGVVTIPTAVAVVGLVWICIADPKDWGTRNPFCGRRCGGGPGGWPSD